jgi:type IV pilus modification protein PilV
MTIVEVLFSILIFSIALLGMAAMQSKAMQKSASSGYKTQAMKLVNEMGDILRAQSSRNDAPISAMFDSLVVDGDDYVDSKSEDSCASGCSSDALVKHYIAVWEEHILNELPLGRGEVKKMVVTNTIGVQTLEVDAYEVTIMWDDRKLSKDYTGSGTLNTGCSGDPTTDLACMKTVVLP